MNEHFFGIFLLGTSLLQGNIAVSNSPNSPHRKLSNLTEDVSVLKQEIKTLQNVEVNFNESLKKISDNTTQQSVAYEQLKNKNETLTSEITSLKSENEALKSEISNLKKLCENLAEQEQKIKTLQTENTNLSGKIQALESNNTHEKDEEVSKLVSNIATIQGELNEIKNELKSTPNALAKLQSDNERTHQKLQTIQDINAQIDELNKNLSLVKNTTDSLTLSRENIEKYLQELYAEIIDKFNRFAQENEQKTEQKQVPTDELKEINHKIETFSSKYQKLDTFNDILASFQEDLSQLKDSSFSLNVSHEKLEKDFQTFSNQTNEQIKTIKQNEVEIDAYKAEAEKTQLNEFKKEMVNKCKNICQKTLTQTNEQLQRLAQQVQTKIDNLRSRTFSKHIILSGESLSSIAKRYSTSPEQILITNNIQSARDLRVGDTIIVPNNL